MAKIADIEAELDQLIADGGLLYYAMVDARGKLPEKVKTQLKKAKTKLPSFNLDYDSWYSVALRLVAQLLPDRLEDFVLQYKGPEAEIHLVPHVHHLRLPRRG